MPSKGTYVFQRMVMGLCNSGATVCALVDKLLSNELEPYLFPYLDDFIIAADSFEKHIEILSRLAVKLQFANLTIRPTKSLFCYKRFKYLGHIIDENGISLDPARIGEDRRNKTCARNGWLISSVHSELCRNNYTDV